MVGEVVVYLVQLVSEVVIDRVVVLLVVPLMRLPCHLSIPHHPPTLLYHTTLSYFHTICVFHTTPKDFPSTCHPTIITHISSLRGHICDVPIFGGPVDNPSTRRISVFGRLAPKSWYLTSTNYPWTPSYSAPLPYVPSPGHIHSYLNLKYEKKMNNYSPYGSDHDPLTIITYTTIYTIVQKNFIKILLYKTLLQKMLLKATCRPPSQSQPRQSAFSLYTPCT